jgi:hypothetical protein
MDEGEQMGTWLSFLDSGAIDKDKEEAGEEENGEQEGEERK